MRVSPPRNMFRHSGRAGQWGHRMPLVASCQPCFIRPGPAHTAQSIQASPTRLHRARPGLARQCVAPTQSPARNGSPQ